MPPFCKTIQSCVFPQLADTANSQKGDALIGFRQPLPNTVPRTVHDKLTECISVKDFGARGDGMGDDTAAIQAAIDRIGENENGGAVFFPPGVYEVKGEIRIPFIRVSLRGAGRYVTHVRLSPTQNGQTLFKFDRGTGDTSWQCAIQDMALVASQDDNGLTKTAIELHNTSNMIVRDLIIGPWTGNGDSVGLRVRGREVGHIDNLHIFADRPLVIEKNADFPLDHFNFNNLYLLVSDCIIQPCVFIADGVNLQNVVFGGFQAWVQGSYGLYWKDTQTTGASHTLTLRNVRTEQTHTSDGYSIYIERKANLNDLLIEQFLADPTQNGIFLRNVERFTLRHATYNGSGIALELDGVAALALDQVLIGVHSRVVMPNLQEKIALNRLYTASPVPDTAYFAQKLASGGALQNALQLFGSTNLWSFSGTLADHAQLALPAGVHEGRKAALIFISAYAAATQTSAGGQVMDTPDQAIRIAGTENFSVGRLSGKLTVLHADAPLVINQLGAAVDLMVWVVWM